MNEPLRKDEFSFFTTLLLIWLALLLAFALIDDSQIRDLQRRVGTLESKQK